MCIHNPNKKMFSISKFWWPPRVVFSMNNSENHAIIYHKQNDLLMNLNMTIVIARMYYILHNTDYYLNEYINYLNSDLYYHSFFGVKYWCLPLKKINFLGGTAGGKRASPLTPPCSCSPAIAELVQDYWWITVV